MSTSQEQVWFFSRLSPELRVYNDGAMIRKRGSLDIDALRWAFKEVVRRHEVWRTTFPVIDGVPIQQVLPPPTYELPVTDLSHLPVPQQEAEAIRLATEDAIAPYDLAQDRLIRPRLVRLAEDDHRLYLALHHIIFDGVSLYRVLLPELVALYEAHVAGQRSPLSEPGLQYGDFAAWQRQHVDEEEDSHRLQYWRRQLGELPNVELPIDHKRRSVQRFRGAIEHIEVGDEVVRALKELAHREGASFFMVVAAAFSVLLQRYSGQDDIVFGTPLDTRTRPELRSMMGDFLNDVVLRIHVDRDLCFTELLARAREATLGAVTNQIAFERLVRELQPARDLSRNPIFQVMFILEPPTPQVDPAWSIHQLHAGSGVAQFDLTFDLDERPEGHVSCRLIYSTDLFKHETIKRMGGHWVQLLRGIVEDPDRQVSELSMMTEAELHQLLVQWNATEARIPGGCAHQLFEAQVERAPLATAAIFEEVSVTYSELDSRANRLANHLRTMGVGPDSTVGLITERSLDMLVGALAILKAGGACAPLDRRLPSDRLAYLLNDAGAVALLTQSHLVKALPPGAAAVVCLDGEAGLWAEQADTAPRSGIEPEHLAHLNYTFSSTARPKGVQIPHRALVNSLWSIAQEYGIGPQDVLVAIAPPGFSMAWMELYLPLIRGARVVIASAEVAADGRRLAELLATSDATFLQAAPATWRMLIESGWEGSPRLTAICGGDVLQPDLAHRLLERCGGVYNAYGSTETTIWSALTELRAGEPITIGRPIANTVLYVLDRHLQPVPVGVAGELFIGGASLARGYRNRPEPTTERFLPSPFIQGDRIYRTGDLVRFLSSGRVAYLGRLEDQTRVRGLRIDLSDIEATLLQQPGVVRAVVVAREDRDGDRRLVAYLVVTSPIPQVPEIRAALRRSLPEYMVPGAFVFLEELPLTSKGKIDLRALPAPEGAVASSSEGGRPPRTEVEREVACMLAELLGLDHVDVEENFLLLGGHSLLGAQLVARIRDRFAVEMPLISLFQAGSIAGLAAEVERLRLRQEASTEGYGSMAVVAQPAGIRPLLFFLVSDESGLIAIRHFVKTLGTDQPVVALLPPRRNRRFERDKSMAQLAEVLLAVMREHQPHGPYCLVGHSLGGLLAYEVARQLRLEGEQIAFVGLLDTMTPVAARLVQQGERRLGARLRRYTGRVGEIGLRRFVHEMAARHLPVLKASVGLPLLPDQFDLHGAVALMYAYQVVGHDVALNVFATRLSTQKARSPGLGWQDVHKGPVRCHAVSGDHHTVLHNPDALVLEILAEQLDEAQHIAARSNAPRR